jgi:hypothetical protein
VSGSDLTLPLAEVDIVQAKAVAVVPFLQADRLRPLLVAAAALPDPTAFVGFQAAVRDLRRFKQVARDSRAHTLAAVRVLGCELSRDPLRSLQGDRAELAEYEARLAEAAAQIGHGVPAEGPLQYKLALLQDIVDRLRMRLTFRALAVSSLLAKGKLVLQQEREQVLCYGQAKIALAALRLHRALAVLYRAAATAFQSKAMAQHLRTAMGAWRGYASDRLAQKARYALAADMRRSALLSLAFRRLRAMRILGGCERSYEQGVAKWASLSLSARTFFAWKLYARHRRTVRSRLDTRLQTLTQTPAPRRVRIAATTATETAEDEKGATIASDCPEELAAVARTLSHTPLQRALRTLDDPLAWTHDAARLRSLSRAHSQSDPVTERVSSAETAGAAHLLAAAVTLSWSYARAVREAYQMKPYIQQMVLLARFLSAEAVAVCLVSRPLEYPSVLQLQGTAAVSMTTKVSRTAALCLHRHLMLRTMQEQTENGDLSSKQADPAGLQGRLVYIARHVFRLCPASDSVVLTVTAACSPGAAPYSCTSTYEREQHVAYAAMQAGRDAWGFWKIFFPNELECENGSGADGTSVQQASEASPSPVPVEADVPLAASEDQDSSFSEFDLKASTIACSLLLRRVFAGWATWAAREKLRKKCDLLWRYRRQAAAFVAWKHHWEVRSAVHAEGGLLLRRIRTRILLKEWALVSRHRSARREAIADHHCLSWMRRRVFKAWAAFALRAHRQQRMCIRLEARRRADTRELAFRHWMSVFRERLPRRTALLQFRKQQRVKVASEIWNKWRVMTDRRLLLKRVLGSALTRWREVIDSEPERNQKQFHFLLTIIKAWRGWAAESAADRFKTQRKYTALAFFKQKALVRTIHQWRAFAQESRLEQKVCDFVHLRVARKVFDAWKRICEARVEASCAVERRQAETRLRTALRTWRQATVAQRFDRRKRVSVAFRHWLDGANTARYLRSAERSLQTWLVRRFQHRVFDVWYRCAVDSVRERLRALHEAAASRKTAAVSAPILTITPTATSAEMNEPDVTEATANYSPGLSVPTLTEKSQEQSHAGHVREEMTSSPEVGRDTVRFMPTSDDTAILEPPMHQRQWTSTDARNKAIAEFIRANLPSNPIASVAPLAQTEIRASVSHALVDRRSVGTDNPLHLNDLSPSSSAMPCAPNSLPRSAVDAATSTADDATLGHSN